MGGRRLGAPLETSHEESMRQVGRACTDAELAAWRIGKAAGRPVRKAFDQLPCSTCRLEHPRHDVLILYPVY